MLDLRHGIPSRLHVQDQQVRHASAENEEAYAWVLE
jgi:hypothetical protein